MVVAHRRAELDIAGEVRDRLRASEPRWCDVGHAGTLVHRRPLKSEPWHRHRPGIMCIRCPARTPHARKPMRVPLSTFQPPKGVPNASDDTGGQLAAVEQAVDDSNRRLTCLAARAARARQRGPLGPHDRCPAHRSPGPPPDGRGRLMRNRRLRRTRFGHRQGEQHPRDRRGTPRRSPRRLSASPRRLPASPGRLPASPGRPLPGQPDQATTAPGTTLWGQDKVTCLPDPRQANLSYVAGEPHIAKSAHRSGIDDQDIRHALHNALWIEPLDEGLSMFVGPDRAGRLLEVGVVDSRDGPIVVHAMEARPKYRR